jgi:hypothetical protein
VDGFERCAREFELAARLDRDGAHARGFGQPDDVLAVEDRLPAEPGLHALQESGNAGLAKIGHRAVVGAEEGELFVLRSEAELLFRTRTAGKVV